MADDIESAGARSAGRVLLGDSRNSDPWRKLFATDQATSCITSPPYLNNFDYADATRLEVYFLGQASSWRELCDSVRSRMMVATTQQSRVAIAKRDARRLAAIPELSGSVNRLTRKLATQRAARPRGKEYDRVVPSYFSGIYSVLGHLRRHLAIGATAAWIVGDSAPYGVYIDTPRLIEVLASHIGFKALGAETLRHRGMRWQQNGSRHQIPLEEKLVLLQRG